RELTPVEVEVLLRRREHVLEREVPALRDVERVRERDLLDERRVRRVLGAALRAALETPLGGAPPVEARPPRGPVGGVAADRVAELEHAGQPLVEVAGVELEQPAVAVSTCAAQAPAKQSACCSARIVAGNSVPVSVWITWPHSWDSTCASVNAPNFLYRAGNKSWLS